MLEPLAQPQRVGPYRLLAALGAGGMGEVYLARREGQPGGATGPLCAVKTVRQDVDLGVEFRTRFRREVNAARAVRSPYTAALIDSDPEAERPWLATEYVAGPSLSEAVARTGPLPPAAVWALAGDLARALDAVHQAQVLHRDLKPGNVLLSADGPKIIDFGISQAFDATALTSTGLVIGSPGFMSPEHIAGSRSMVAASDVFCLGALLCFAATGRSPFEDEEMGAVIYRISRADADLTGVPEQLRGVLADCLRLDPADRPTPRDLVRRAGGRTAAGPFPWPAGVLSLLAEYGEAARRCVQAADPPTAGPAWTPTMPGTARRPHHPPTAPGLAVPAQVPPAPARRRRRLPVVLGALTVAAIVLGTVLVPRLTAHSGPSAAGPDRPRPAATPPPVITDRGNPGRTGEFGPQAENTALRPADWSPWQTRLPRGTGRCALSSGVLVCGHTGGATALKAATGATLWTRPWGRSSASPASYTPLIVGDTVYLPSPDAVTVVRLTTGEVLWRQPAPDGYFVESAQVFEGVVYTAFLQQTESEIARRRYAARLTTGDHRLLWQVDGPQSAGMDMLVTQGRLYVSTGIKVVALDSHTGAEVARNDRVPCYGLMAHDGSVLCWANGTDRVLVLDGRTLDQRRSIGSGIQLGDQPAVGDRNILVVNDSAGNRLIGYDMASGRQLWSTGTADGGTPLLTGDRVLLVGRYGVNSHPLAADPPMGSSQAYQGWPQDADRVGEPSALISGGVVYLSFSDGTVISAYVPAAPSP